jgi:ureidoacrylate peracid hydrolase
VAGAHAAGWRMDLDAAVHQALSLEAPPDRATGSGQPAARVRPASESTSAASMPKFSRTYVLQWVQGGVRLVARHEDAMYDQRMGDFTFQITPQALDPRRAALMVVDLENEFCRPDGKAYLGQRALAAVERAKGMIERCRELAIPIIFIRSIREPDAMEFRTFGQQPFLLRGSDGVEFAADISPRAEEPVVEKHSHDPFNHTDLEVTLERSGIRPGDQTVMVAGVATSVCVMCAVVGLSVRHFRVALLTDCCASATERAEQLTYELLGGRAYSYNVALTSSTALSFRQLAAVTA